MELPEGGGHAIRPCLRGILGARGGHYTHFGVIFFVPSQKHAIWE